MTRYVLLASVLALLSIPATVSAQMAGALGKPLSVANLSVGTVTVRVIAGTPDKPLVGINVQLVSAEGKAMVSRTDGEGRATFSNLKPGARYVAKAEEPGDESSGTQAQKTESAPFTIPDSGGIRMLLSTRGWQGGGAAAPSMPAGAPAMAPRKMSGIPRGDGAEPARQMTIAAVTGSVSNRIPGHPIHLIAYGADGTITRETQVTGEDGRVRFSGLKPRTHAYYAMTTFKNGTKSDRVLSDPVSVPPRVGIRMMLAGNPEGGTSPPVEDLSLLANQSERVKPGEVMAQLFFRDPKLSPNSIALLEIVDGGQPPREVATLPVSPATPADVTADFGAPVALPNQPVGNVTITTLNMGQPGQNSNPIPGVIVTLEPVDAPPAPAQPATNGGAPAAANGGAPAAANATAAGSPQPTPRVTDQQGNAQLTAAIAGQKYRAILTLAGTRVTSEPFEIPAAGGMALTATLGLRYESSAEARFTNVATDKIYVLEARYGQRKQRTRPFQTVADRGAVMGFPPYDKPLLLFHFAGWTDDKFMGFQGQISLHNTDPMPWDPGKNGLAIPLPAGFIGGRVDDNVTDMVKVEPGKGLIWRDLVAPGRRPFVMGFSMPIESGTTEFSMELPLGVLQGNIVLMKSPGMRVENLTKGLRAAPRQARDGRDIVEISKIRFPSGGRLKFTVTGLPQAPASERHIRNVIGVIVLVVMGWTLFQLFSHRRRQTLLANAAARADQSDARSGTSKLTKRREDLLEQLVELETKKRLKQVNDDVYKKQRQKLKGRLEAVYTDIQKLERQDEQPAN